MATNPTEILLDKAPAFPPAPSHWPAASEQHRSRAPEFYGFVALTSTYLAYILYILWAITPDEYIKKTGITWYPNRYGLVPSPSVDADEDSGLQRMGSLDTFMERRPCHPDLYHILGHRHSRSARI